MGGDDLTVVAVPSHAGAGKTCLDQFRDSCKQTKRLIQLKLVYIRYVADVQTLDQTFKTAFGLDMLWPATDADKRAYQADPITFTPAWVPNFEFPSAKEVTLERRALVTGNPFKVTPEGFNFVRTLVTGVFMEQFELRNYPFDVQDLTVIMDMSFDLKEEALFIPWTESYSLDPNGTPSETKNFIQLNRAFSAIPDFDARRIVAEFAVRDNCWGIQMVRRPEGTLGRIASLCCLLAIATLCTFSIDPIGGHADRVNFLITNVLAFVAFQFIVSSQLPMTPYLTILDRYTLSTFVYLVCLVGILSILARSDFDTEFRVYVDNILFFVSLGIVGFIQAFYIATGIYQRTIELSKLKKSMKELDDVNRGEDDSPVSVFGAGFLALDTKETRGDPFCSFEGLEKS